MRLRMPRYSLATMLLVITATALLLWAIPAGREFLRRMAIERALCQLTIGLEPDLFAAMPLDSHRDLLSGTFFYDVEGNSIRATMMFYERHWYCIYAHTEKLTPRDKAQLERENRKLRDTFEKAVKAGVAQGLKPSEAVKKAFKADYGLHLTRGVPIIGRWSKVYVYRLQPMPRGYKAQSKRGKQQVMRGSDHQLVDRTPQGQYLTDFYEIIAGREKRDLGIKYELIHADPPIATE
jgi:hypothetical protein